MNKSLPTPTSGGMTTLHAPARSRGVHSTLSTQINAVYHAAVMQRSRTVRIRSSQRVTSHSLCNW